MKDVIYLFNGDGEVSTTTVSHFRTPNFTEETYLYDRDYESWLKVSTEGKLLPIYRAEVPNHLLLKLSLMGE